MAVFLSINAGYDPEYPWKQIGTDDREAANPLDYYLTPVDAGGEPPGVWHGRAAARLGITEGSLVDKEEFKTLFGEHVHPQTGEHLGRASYQFKGEKDIYAELAAAEPYASEARKDELRGQARRLTRRAVPFFDFTMSMSKDISLTYVSLLAWAEKARRAGDMEGAARWAERAARIPYWIQKGREAMMDALQDEAGYTRTGYHRGSGADSNADLGRFEAAREWVYASFFQHDSRDGDPQLHIHNLVLNKVPLVQPDGQVKWLTIDAKVAYSMKRWAASVGAATVEAGMSRDLGVVWEPRPDGNGRQIKGVSQEMMDKFSHRRQTIKAEAALIAALREAKWGKAPNARQMDRIQRDITERSRKAKASGPLDLAARLEMWEEQAAEADLGDFRSIWTGVGTEGERWRVRQEVIARTAAAITAELERPVDGAEQRQIEGYAAYITRNGEFGSPVDPVDLTAGYVATRDRDAQDRAELAGRFAAEETVMATARAMSWEFAQQAGRAPDPGEFARMQRFANWVTRRGTDARPVDAALLLQGWQAQEAADVLRERDTARDIERARAQARADASAVLSRQVRADERAARVTEGGRLGAMERARAVAYPAEHGGGLTEDQARQVMTEALYKAQRSKTKWPKADLAARILDLMPEGSHGDREIAGKLAERALAGGTGEPVVLLDPPLWPVPPASLLRPEDGESVFIRHATERYATQAQLDVEQLLLSQAQDPAAPRLPPELAARLLGADPAKLETLLSADGALSAEALSERAGSGLRADQAAAAWFVLTSARRAEVLAGPAGTGKTRTAAELAKAWSQARMGPVVALTTTSSARDVIRDEAAQHNAPMSAYNTAEWLGHLPHAREARPAVELEPRTLLILDEASMMTVPDLAAIMRRATEHGAKVVLTGDPEQLQAPENGGGMTLLASRLGWVQLTEPQRFRQQWERGASLRLRAGDDTVLADYRRRDRLHSGQAETTLEDAARTWLHGHLNGKDILLMTGSEQQAAELSRRIRDDLIHWGKVSDGAVIRIRDGQHASAGDLIMARRNDKLIRTDRPQGITNRDVLRIATTSPDPASLWVQVQRLTGRDDTGREQWSAPFSLPSAYLRKEAQLAYAVTFHAAEGRTVDEGISVYDGTEDRRSVNVGMTRGRDRNDAYVITGHDLSDATPGTRTAPELDRYTRLQAEREGRAVAVRAPAKLQAADAEAILAHCLARDGREPSALEYQEKAWSDADRLDVLAVQWQHVTRGADRQRYAQAVRDTLSQQDADDVLAHPAVETLWRTLREAEHTGITPAGALTRAAAQGPLDTAESIAKVINWRVRNFTEHMTAQPARPWTEQVRQTGDPDTDRYTAELAAAMDDRTHRLGEHAAEHPPAWARDLGPVPADPLARLDWEHKAAQVAAYREMHGHAHPHDPIGPRPGEHSPEARAMWQAAATALGYTPADLRDKTDGNLWARRRAHAQEMAWQPRYPGDDITEARAGIRVAVLDADRARRDAQAADPEHREALLSLAAYHEQHAEEARNRERQLSGEQEAYDAWDAATRTTREYALAADAELRRRHPDMILPPLAGTGQQDTGKPPFVPARPASPGKVAEAVQPMLPGMPADPAPAREPVTVSAGEARERAADIMSMSIPSENPDAAPEPAWTARPGHLWDIYTAPAGQRGAAQAAYAQANGLDSEPPPDHDHYRSIRYQEEYPLRPAEALLTLSQPRAPEPPETEIG